MKSSKTSIFILLAFFVGIAFFSCKDGNDVLTTDSSLRLAFSSDTVRFDTVFTTIKTATKRVLIRNENKNAVNIESIKLMGGNNSNFRMNVDGFSGDQQNIELRGQDSLYLFVELTANPQNQNNPVFIHDSIQFVFNGVTQYVRLEAYGQDVCIWKNKTITQDTTLLGEKPILVYDSLTIVNGAKLTINPGTKFYFHNGAGMYIKGQIMANGTVDEPITFKGDRTDNLFANVTYNNGMSGQWNGIFIDSISYGNVFQNILVRSSNYGINFEKSLSQQKKATMTKVIIQNVMNDALSATNCNIDFFNCLITNAKETCVRLIGGQYTFLHCTLANYFQSVSESRSINSRTLVLGNIFNNSILPLELCGLTNCIISGSSNTEIELNNTLNGNIQQPFNYLFTNCLINMNGTDDENFVNTIWNKQPDFVNLNDNQDYVFSFELDSTSAAINAANRTYSLQLPYDLRNVSRLNDNNPDIGCYEWKPKNP